MDRPSGPPPLSGWTITGPPPRAHLRRWEWWEFRPSKAFPCFFLKKFSFLDFLQGSSPPALLHYLLASIYGDGRFWICGLGIVTAGWYRHRTPLSLPALRREARAAFAEGYHRGRQRGEKAVARTEAQEGRAPVRRQEATRGAEVGHTPAVEEEEDEGHESPISPATRLGRENADAILRFGPRLDIEYLQRLLTRERGEEVEEDPRCAAHSS